MPRIPALELEQTQGETRLAFEQGLARFGRMTNMKRTMLQSLPTYHALLEWYPLFDTIVSFTGERAAVIFAHAISVGSDCLICTTFMRRLLINAGDDPSALALDEAEQVLVDFGGAIAAQGNRVDEELYRQAGILLHHGADCSPDRLCRLDGGDQFAQQRAGGRPGRVPVRVSGMNQGHSFYVCLS